MSDRPEIECPTCEGDGCLDCNDTGYRTMTEDELDAAAERQAEDAASEPPVTMGEATGAAMAEWAKGQGGAQKQKETMDFAREKARGGTEAFTAWWNSDAGKAARAVVRPIMEEIKAICAEADRDANRSDDDPFGEGPADSQRGEQFNGTDEFSADAMAEKVRRETNAMAAAA